MDIQSTATVVWLAASVYTGGSFTIEPGTSGLVVLLFELNSELPAKSAWWKDLPQGTTKAELHWPAIICQDADGNILGRIEKPFWDNTQE